MRTLQQLAARLEKLEALHNGGLHCYAIGGATDEARAANEEQARRHLAATLGRSVSDADLIVFVRRFADDAPGMLPQ